MFMRSRRLFLRPIWPEDQAPDQIPDRMPDQASDRGADAVGGAAGQPPRAAHPRFPRWLVIRPDHPGGALAIGHVWLEPAGVSPLHRTTATAGIRCHIAPAQRRRGYGVEALRAAAAMAHVLGHRRLVAALAGAIDPAAARTLAGAGFRRGAGAAWELDLTVANRPLVLGSAA